MSDTFEDDRDQIIRAQADQITALREIIRDQNELIVVLRDAHDIRYFQNHTALAPGKGGPRRRKYDSSKLIEARGKQGRSVFAGLIGISTDTLVRVEETGNAGKDTIDKIESYLKENTKKKDTQNPH